MTVAPWWAGPPAIAVRHACDDDVHVLVWLHGRLLAIDHADSEGERLLAAMGASAPDCIEMLGTWRRLADDLDLLALGPQSNLDEMKHLDLATLEALEERIEHMLARRSRSRSPLATGGSLPHVRSGPAGGRPAPYRLVRARTATSSAGAISPWLSRAVGGDRPAMWWRDVLRIMSLPRSFLDRLLLQIVAARSDDLRSAVRALAARGEQAKNASAHLEDAPALYAAAASRVRAAVRLWLFEQAAGEVPEVRISLSPDDATLTIAPAPADDEHSSAAGPVACVQVTVGSSWLADVWARQMSVVDGYLVTEVLSVGDGVAVVRALRNPGPHCEAHPRTIELARRVVADAWTVACR
jgi:hypothetical protein